MAAAAGAAGCGAVAAGGGAGTKHMRSEADRATDEYNAKRIRVYFAPLLPALPAVASVRPAPPGGSSLLPVVGHVLPTGQVLAAEAKRCGVAVWSARFLADAIGAALHATGCCPTLAFRWLSATFESAQWLPSVVSHMVDSLMGHGLWRGCSPFIESQVNPALEGCAACKAAHEGLGATGVVFPNDREHLRKPISILEGWFVDYHRSIGSSLNYAAATSSSSRSGMLLSDFSESRFLCFITIPTRKRVLPEPNPTDEHINHTTEICFAIAAAQFCGLVADHPGGLLMAHLAIKPKYDVAWQPIADPRAPRWGTAPLESLIQKTTRADLLSLSRPHPWLRLVTGFDNGLECGRLLPPDAAVRIMVNGEFIRGKVSDRVGRLRGQIGLALSAIFASANGRAAATASTLILDFYMS
jgi:hypothetical protein